MFSLRNFFISQLDLNFLDQIIKHPTCVNAKSTGEVGYISKSAWDILTGAQQTTLKNQYFHQGYKVEYDDCDSVYVIKEIEKDKGIKESLLYFKDYLSEFDNFYIFF